MLNKPLPSLSNNNTNRLKPCLASSLVLLPVLIFFVTSTQYHAENHIISPRSLVDRCDTRPPPLGTAFDVMVLNLVWPPAYNMPQSYFVVQGLWPSRGLSTQWPCYCNRSSIFDPTLLLPDVRAGMDSYFPILSGNTMNLWKTEWEMHGTCYTKDMNTFFATAVAARNALRPVKIMQRAGITPSTNPFPYDTIASVFRGAGLGCSGIQADGYQILQNIQFCYKPDMQTTILCPPMAITGACRMDTPIRLIPGDLEDQYDVLTQQESSVSTTVAGGFVLFFVGGGGIAIAINNYMIYLKKKEEESKAAGIGMGDQTTHDQQQHPKTDDEEESNGIVEPVSENAPEGHRDDVILTVI